MPDTSPIFNQSMLPYLNIDNKNTLNIKIELGYIVIQPRNKIFHSSILDLVDNFYLPVPGGNQGRSFIYNDAFKKQKSNSLKTTTTGVMPSHIDVQGAPYCTFIEGSLEPGKPHPYYDLIIAPTGIQNYNPSSYAQFNTNANLIQTNFQSAFDNANLSKIAKQTSKVGSIYIPASTKNNSAIANLTSSNIPVKPLTTYNVWKIDGFKTDNFTNVGNLGFYPKSGAAYQNLQPYAQTWPYTYTSGVQVYASNVEVSLTRIFPMLKDIAHDPEASYVVFNSVSDVSGTNRNVEANPLQTNYIGLNHGNQPVGFVMRFDTVFTNTIPVSASTGVGNSQVILTEPRLLISWGALNSPNSEVQNKYSSVKRIAVYTLDITPGKNPKLYYNLTTADVLNPQNQDINENSVEIPNLKPLEINNSTSGIKNAGSYDLYVYYSGPFLYIGNSTDPSSWSPIKGWTKKPSAFDVASNTSSDNLSYVTYENWLDETSTINVTARNMNFVFYYGPPLFNPFDEDNKAFSNQTSTGVLQNSKNQISTIISNTIPADVESPVAYANALIGNIKQSIISNSAVSFQNVNSKGLYGGATAYHDVRAGISNNADSIGLEKYQSSVTYLGQDTNDPNYHYFGVKITMPVDLGGHSFGRFYDNATIDEPQIAESYSFYDLQSLDPENTISDILTSTLTSLSITKKIDDSPSTTLKQSADIQFTNLNRSKTGSLILQFMRQNVSVIKISAGYGKEMNIFFEGIISSVKAQESLATTIVTISAEDLMQHLFEQKETCIVSRNRMNFYGMQFYNLIKELVHYTELHNHFEFRMGSANDNQSLFYNLKNNPDFKIPPVPNLANNKNISNLTVGAYSDQDTYLKVLRQLIPLMLQGPATLTGIGTQMPYDIPLLYWYAGVKNNQNVNGVVMTSRSQNKDRDKFYIRRSELVKPDGKSPLQIVDLHGTIFGNENVFTSENQSTNMHTVGLYRGLGLDQSPISAKYQNTNALQSPVGLFSTGYIGYNRVLIFDSANENFTGGLPSYLISDQRRANAFVKKYMDLVFSSVYENIILTCLVTKPLHEWGNFVLFYENDDQPLINDPNDAYFYGSVRYNFKIEENLIVAEVNGAKKPIQGAK